MSLFRTALFFLLFTAFFQLNDISFANPESSSSKKEEAGQGEVDDNSKKTKNKPEAPGKEKPDLESEIKKTLENEEAKRKILEGAEGLILLLEGLIDVALDQVDRSAEDIKKNKEVYREKLKKKMEAAREVLKKELEKNTDKDEKKANDKENKL